MLLLFGAFGEGRVGALIEEKVRGARIQSIQKGRWGPLYEVVVRGTDRTRICNADGDAKVAIADRVIDAQSGRNFTKSRQP